jgi:hypothetical protein
MPSVVPPTFHVAPKRYVLHRWPITVALRDSLPPAKAGRCRANGWYSLPSFPEMALSQWPPVAVGSYQLLVPLCARYIRSAISISSWRGIFKGPFIPMPDVGLEIDALGGPHPQPLSCGRGEPEPEPEPEPEADVPPALHYSIAAPRPVGEGVGGEVHPPLKQAAEW